MHTIAAPVAPIASPFVMPPATLPVRAASRRIVSLDVLRGIAILLMVFSGMIPKTLPNWMDHGYQPHYKPDGAGAWHSVLDGGTDAVFQMRWKAMTWVDLVFPMFLFSMGAALPMAMGRRLIDGGSRLALLRTIVARWVMLLVFAVLIGALNPPSSDALDDNARRLMVLAGFAVAFLFFVRWPASVPAGTQRAIRWTTGLAIALLCVAYATQRATLAASSGRNGLLFSWGQSDIIIKVLAHCYLVAAIAWLILPRLGWLRLALLAPFILIAHYISIDRTATPDWLWMGNWPWTHVWFHANDVDWTTAAIAQSPSRVFDLGRWIAPLHEAVATRPWLARLVNFAPMWDYTWYKYLWVVVPGTIVGDLVARWSREARPLADGGPRVDVSAVSGTSIDPSLRAIMPAPRIVEADSLVVASRPYPATLVLLLAIATTIAICVGFRHYGQRTLGIGGPLRTPWPALTFGVPLAIATAAVVRTRAGCDFWLLRRLGMIGLAFLVIGVALACWPSHVARADPIETPVGSIGFFEGGISKGPPSTLSYYATSVGLSTLLLTGLLGVLDLRPTMKRRRLGLLEANGQNPLLVYFLEHLVINSVFGLTIFAALHHAGEVGWWSHVNALDDLGRTNAPWLGGLWGAFKTLLMAGAVWVCTRRKIYWRA